MTRTLLTIMALALASPAASAAQDLTRSVGQQLEEEVRHRAELHSDADVVIEGVRISNSSIASSATAVVRVELPAGEDGLGRVAAKALLIGSDGSEAWTWVQANVAASVPTVVAARSLSRGDIINESDVELTMRPVHRQNVTRTAETVGHVLKRPIRAGEPLRTTWFTEAYAVERGDVVETIFRRGSVRARGTAEAAQRGKLGDIIRVKVTNSRRTLRARVLDNRRVEVIR